MDLDEAQAQSAEAFTWRAHPAREQRGRLFVGIAWIAAVVLVVYATTSSAPWAAFSLLVLVFALNRFFFPSRFTIDEDGITAEHVLRTKRLLWRDVRRFAYNDDGAYLSRHATPSRLDASRGMHILFGNRRDEVIEMIQRSVAQSKEAK